MSQLGIDAIVAIVALLLWAVAFLPVRAVVRRLVGENGRRRSPMTAEVIMLAHLALLVVGLIAALDLGLEIALH